MKKRIFMLIVCICVLCCAGCDTYAMTGLYPNDRANTWYCKDLDCTIHFTPGGDDTFILCWDDVEYKAGIGFQAGNYLVFIENEDGIIDMDDRLFSGAWLYKDDNLVLNIQEDYLFEGAFKQIIFVPQE